MKTILLILLLASWRLCALAFEVTLQFTPAPEPPGFIAGYRLYHGPAPDAKTNVYHVPAQSEHVVLVTLTNVPPGPFYAAVTAIATNGLESHFSNEVTTNLLSAELTLVLRFQASTNLITWTNLATVTNTVPRLDPQQFYRAIFDPLDLDLGIQLNHLRHR